MAAPASGGSYASRQKLKDHPSPPTDSAVPLSTFPISDRTRNNFNCTNILIFLVL
jgi:hypothetical protein